MKNVFAMLGTAYLDDSADATHSDVFVAAGLFCVDQEWKRLRREWRKILKPHNIAYFRSTDCRNLSGGFEKLKERWREEKARTIVDRIYIQLERLIESSNLLIGCGFGINMKDFHEVDEMPEARINRKWMRDCHDYQTFAFKNMFGYFADTVTKLLEGNNYIVFVCDNSTHYRKIKRGFDRFRQKYPDLGERMPSLTAQDDKLTGELQMADFMADVTREMVTRHLATANATQTEPKAIKTRILNVDCWTKHSMLKIMRGEAPGI